MRHNLDLMEEAKSSPINIEISEAETGRGAQQEVPSNLQDLQYDIDPSLMRVLPSESPNRVPARPKEPPKDFLGQISTKQQHLVERIVSTGKPD